jgi:polyphosphate kinase
MASEFFFNRELSWIEFNARVLEEALDQGAPLLERLKFLIIVASNFDEFFMVRVASLKARARSGEVERDSAGLSPAETLASISKRVREIVGRQYDCLLREILPSLADKGLSIVRPASWSAAERRWLERYFAESIAPALTPLRVEAGEDGKDIFPTAGNLRVHAAFLLRREDTQREDTRREDIVGDNVAVARQEVLALVQVPPNLERLVRLPSEGPGLRLALIDDIVASFGSRLFPGYGVRESLLFKVTRDADIGVDEDRDVDFLAAMEEVLADRQNSYPVRLCVSPDSEALAERIRTGLGLENEDLYTMYGPLELKDLLELAEGEGAAAFPGVERLKFEAWPPIRVAAPPEGVSIWDEIRRQDKLLHLPYESFDPVVHFLDEASMDPAVLAIKMTLYRTSGNSPVVRALTRAARNGKQVAVLIEVKARFDEERNIAWASRLEQAGAIVVYGLARLKVHAKAALVVRREESGTIRRYLHLSTGNYNDKTARLYADLSIFTANEELCREASIFFNMITGYSTVQELRFLAVAPFDLKSRLISMIEREAQRSSPEAPGLIMAKLNSLADPEVIKALYRANAAGVRIMLNVRGIAMLVPGVKGLSERISVVSVVGRYLEHARIIYFRNGGAEELYLSSADWMPRNLERRVELMFPVLDEEARRRVLEILKAYFRDNSKAHRLGPSGRWRKVEAAEGEERFSAQAYFYETVKRRQTLAEEPPERSLQVRKRPS